MSHSESQRPLAVHSSGMEGTACLTLRVKVHLLSILVEWRWNGGYCMPHSESQGPLAVHSSRMEGTACLTLRVKVHLLYNLVEWRGLHVSLRESRSTCCPF